MKKETEIIPFNRNIRLILSQWNVVAAIEMDQGIINVLSPFDIAEYELPDNYKHFTVQHLKAGSFGIVGLENN